MLLRMLNLLTAVAFEGRICWPSSSVFLFQSSVYASFTVTAESVLKWEFPLHGSPLVGFQGQNFLAEWKKKSFENRNSEMVLRKVKVFVGFVYVTIEKHATSKSFWNHI